MKSRDAPIERERGELPGVPRGSFLVHLFISHKEVVIALLGRLFFSADSLTARYGILCSIEWRDLFVAITPKIPKVSSRLPLRRFCAISQNYSRIIVHG